MYRTVVLQYLGIVTVPVFWLIFASRYSGRDHWFKTRNFILISIIPLTTLIMVITNQYHGLFYVSTAIAGHPLGFYHQFVPGVFYWIHNAYSYFISFIALTAIINMFFTVPADGKSRVLIVLLGSVLPLGFGLLYALNIRLGNNIDLTPLGFIMMALLAIVAFKNRLLNHKPLVVNALYDNMPDAIFSTNDRDEIVSTNPRAVTLMNENNITPDQMMRYFKSDAFVDDLVTGSQILEICTENRSFRIRKTDIFNNRKEKKGQIFVIVDITKEKEYRDALTKSEEQYRLLFDNAQEGIVVVQHRKLVFYNQVIMQLTGYNEKELGSTTIDELICRFDMHLVKKIYDDFVSGRSISNKNQIRLSQKNGTAYWVEFSLVEIEWSGERAGLIFVNDINEKKQAEELKALLINISSNYINADVGNFDETINETLCEMGAFVDADRAYIFDYDWVEGVCNNTYEWCADGISPEIENLQGVPIDAIPQWVNTHKNNLPMYVDNVFLLKEGDPLREILEPQGIQSLITIPMTDGDNCAGFVGFDSVKQLHKYSEQEKVLLQVFAQMLVNFSNRRKDHEQIRKQVEIQQLINSVSSELISASVDNIDQKISRVLELSGSFLKVDRSYLLRYSSDNNIENNTHEWCAGGVCSFKKSLQDVLMDRFPWWRQQVENMQVINIPDVSLLPEEAALEQQEFIRQDIKSLLSMPIVNNYRLIGFIGFDAVEQKRNWSKSEIELISLLSNILGDTLVRIEMEIELVRSKEIAESASKAKSNFLSNMSHEIRTPLNGVIGFTELLRNTTLTKTQRDYLDNAMNSANSLLSVISDILDFSKIESGRLEIEKVKTDIVKLFEDSSDIIKLHASNKGLELLLNIAPDIPRYAVLDPIRVKQILVNLLSNAVKFTHVGEIEMSLSFDKLNQKTGIFSISVRDTGIGIREEDRGKLFKAFSQADTSTTRRYGGTGLGLIISNSLAAKMGSEIKFDSVPGEGTTFYFDLQCDYEVGSNDRTEEELEIKSVLVVDDNPHNLMIMEHTLGYRGLQFKGAASGPEAISFLNEGYRYDLIIVDYHMPDIDGLETIQRIREVMQDKENLQPVIILHSSSDSVDLHERARSLGVNFLLTKPVKQDELFYYLRGIGKGSEISVYKDLPEDDSLVKLATVTDLRIMVVEDTPMNMMVITNMLRTMIPGVIIIEAVNGLEAIMLLKNNHPSLIMMDVQMPELDGLEATNQIRKLRGASSIPVVALTAGVSKEEREKCFNAGMDDFLAKPIDRKELERVIRKYLLKNEQNPGSDHMTNDSPSFNREGLLGKLGNEDDMISILKIACREFPVYINNLEAAFQKRDLKRLKQEAHRLKGSALNMEFPVMAAIMKEIEVNVNNAVLVEELIEKLRSEWISILKITGIE